MPGAVSPHPHRSGFRPAAARESLRRGSVKGPRLLIPVLLGLFAVAGVVPSVAGATDLKPCNAAPAGPIVTLDGAAILDRTASGRKMLRRSGVKTSLVRPANTLTGWPSFPVKKVRFGATSRVWLKGGLRFKRKRKSIIARHLVVLVPRNGKRPVRVTARLGKRKVVLFRLRGESRQIRRQKGDLNLRHARSRLGNTAVNLVNRRLGLRKAPKRKRLLRGVVFDRFDLNATYFVSRPDDPVAETPVEPPVADQPAGAIPVNGPSVGETSIKWELRDSWIEYVNTGGKPTIGGGVTADDPRPMKRDPSVKLVYSYNFPFSSGWTVPGGNPEPTLIRGTGSLAFRYCEHTVNFKVSNPEIELNGPEDSRMIFRVDGTDGTAFPKMRAVLVKLIPDRNTQRTETTGNGITTVHWEKIPGYIPAEGTGVFAGFYPAWEPANGLPGSGYTEATRPDRFGFLSVTYTVADGDKP